MSADDDLEHILRGRLEALPEPDGETTRQARERVVGVVPRYRRRRVRITARHDGALGSPLGQA